MKRISFLAMFVAAVALLSTSCGTSDSVKSIYLTSAATSTGSTTGTTVYNLPGVDATLQLKAFAVYHSGRQVDITNDSTWNVQPVGCVFSGNPNAPCGGPLPAYGPDSVPISKTGLMTGIAQICTWMDPDVTTGTPPNTTTAPANPPIWEYTGYYQTTATYNGMTSQPVGIGVGVTASNAPTGGCGPA